jgi:hypothetical protein
VKCQRNNNIIKWEGKFLELESGRPKPTMRCVSVKSLFRLLGLVICVFLCHRFKLVIGKAGKGFGGNGNMKTRVVRNKPRCADSKLGEGAV